MTKILFVTNDSWFFVSHRLPIAKSLVEKQFQAVVSAKPDDTVQQILDAGCEFENWVVLPRGRSIISEIRAVISLANTIRKHKPDLIHLITIKSVLYGGVLARLLRVSSCVYAVSGLGSVFLTDTAKARFLRAMIKPLYRFAISHKNSVLIFQNPDDRDGLLKQIDKPNLATTLIRGSGVDLSGFAVVDEPEGIPVVTLAARLLKDKGIVEFIKAAQRLKEQGIVAKFQIAGANIADGNPAAFTEDELADLHLNEYVEMLGHCSNIADLFAKSNIVVLPSYREGLPKVLVEAGAAGRAVVTTDVPGCRDAVTTNETALLVPVKNAEALATAIAELLADKEKRIRMGLAGRELVQSTMSIEKIVDQHLKLYSKLLKSVVH